MRRNPLMLPFVCVLALLVMSCGSDGSTQIGVPTAPSAEPSAPVATSGSVETPRPAATAIASIGPTATESPTNRPIVEQVVNVYWAGTVVNATGSPERLLAGGRSINSADAVYAAVEALLVGPNALETEIGMFTSIPASTSLLDLRINAGIAVVDLSVDFEDSSGSLDEYLRVAQVVFTLTQFEPVDAVSFRIEGDDKLSLASHGIDVSEPLDRNDFQSVRASIMLEQPYPGARIRSGDRIKGESNTFEGNLQWVVVDAEGLIIGEGFTTAAGGNGTWGRFDFAVVLVSEPAGRGSLIVFESSAEDGSQTNVVEYPIELVGA